MFIADDIPATVVTSLEIPATVVMLADIPANVVIFVFAPATVEILELAFATVLILVELLLTVVIAELNPATVFTQQGHQMQRPVRCGCCENYPGMVLTRIKIPQRGTGECGTGHDPQDLWAPRAP